MENNTATITIDNRFAIIPHWVIKSGVPATAIHLYTVLVMYVDGRTGEAFPSRTTLAKQIGASTKTVDRAIKALQGVGALEVHSRKRPGSKENYTNIYRLITAKHTQEVGTPLSPPRDTSVAENYNHLTKPTLPTPSSFDEELNLALPRSRSHSEPATSPHMRAREICHQIHTQDAWDLESTLWSELVDELNRLVGHGSDIAHTLFNQGWFESLYRATGDTKGAGLGIATWVSKIIAYERQQPHIARHTSKPASDPWQV